MKNLKYLILSFCLLFSCTLFAQQAIFEKINQSPWTFQDFSDGTFQQNIYKNYFLQFKDEGTGVLSVLLTYETEGEGTLTFSGAVPFTYTQSSEETSNEKELVLNIRYGKLKFISMENRRDRKQRSFDESVLKDLENSFSNNTATYHMTYSDEYLVIEGFTQNEKSSFTYFEKNPVTNSF